jgi:arylsulfatase A-like enzyme
MDNDGKKNGITLNFKELALIGLALGYAAPSLGENKKASTQKPNIVFVFADQLRYQSVGYAGDTKALTPNIDQLSTQGANFTNMVSSCPVCAAFRASLLTGKYPSSTGMVVNELRINPNQKSIAHVLTENGYETGYIGKWHLWANGSDHYRMESSYIPPDKREYRLGFDGYWAAFNFNHQFYKGFYYENDTVKHIVKGFEPDVQTDMAIDYLKKVSAKDKPFCLFLSLGTPHDPWRKENVPEEYYNQFRNVDFPLPVSWKDTPDPYMDRNAEPDKWLTNWKVNLPEMQRIYYAMTANLDHNLGRLLAAMEQMGLNENTIFVFTSDHGEMFGAHGRVFKLTFYDEASRIPMLIRWPGKIPAGLKSDACFNTPDIMPTLLGLMDLPIPTAVEGMNLSNQVLGKKGPEPDAAFLQGMGHTYLWQNGFEWRALRDKRYTYARYRIDGKELLFDNQNDPLQINNLIQNVEYQKIAGKLRSLMAKKMKSLDDNFETCTWYRDHWTDGKRNIIAGAHGKFSN